MAQSDKYYTAVDAKAKIGDEPLKVTDTGFKFAGKRLLIQGDQTDANRFAWYVERYYPEIRMSLD